MGRLRMPGLVDEIGKPPADKGDEVDTRGDKQHNEIQADALIEVERAEPSPEPFAEVFVGLPVTLGLAALPDPTRIKLNG
jgi:hypothetical protein